MPGYVAFSNIASGGHYQGGFKGKKLFAHRVVWFLHHGTWPELIDHINGNPLDNRILNLREGTSQVNNHNRLARGVYKQPRGGGYQARIRVNGVPHCLGTYPDGQTARHAYLLAKRKYHPTAPERCYDTEGGLATPRKAVSNRPEAQS